MADDIFCGLRDTMQLPDLKVVIAAHERASGGLNNWLKTFGLRVGGLRGSTIMPPGWDPNHVDFSTDVIRYLGVFMGSHAAVLAKWLPPDGSPLDGNDLTSRMTQRLRLWSSLGVGPTYAGRNLVVKNSVLAMAWFLAECQTLPNIDTVLTRWQRMAWSFFESPATPLRTHSFSAPPPSAHHVSRTVLVQDYPEGGRRCLDVELFTRALRMRAVRHLFEPTPHPYKLLVFHWIRLSYPHLPYHPITILLSNCDMSHLHASMPAFWKETLIAWGTQGRAFLISR
jgi:hypothetical protein